MNGKPPVDKLLVTNSSALLAKFGATGMAAIQTAIATLIANDGQKGITTQLVNIDSTSDMAAIGAVAVTAPTDQRANKAAVDAAFSRYLPDYLVILGAPDIVPHQDLDNPVYSPLQDDDKLVPSDLPYACTAGYSTTISDFIGPTRVIGRVPDLNGGADLKNFVNVLANAGTAAPKNLSAYQNAFALTAAVWQQSTTLSIAAAFGSGITLHNSPLEGPAWTSAELAPLSHFINCHGAAVDPKFYGQQGASYPIAHEAAALLGQVSAGTVVAAECCYGAQLYPVVVPGGQAGICSTYLNSGATAFYGSTTIAYGPVASNDWADLLCQYFFSGILAGLSTGHAALAALQRYIAAKPLMDPTSLKTIAQFLLLGDPSLCPVSAPISKSFGMSAIAASTVAEDMRNARQLRRQVLEQQGTALGLTTAYVTRAAVSTANALEVQVAKSVGLSDLGEYLVIGSFDVTRHAVSGVTAMQKSPSGQRVHLWGKRNRIAGNANIVDIHLIVGLESAGQLILITQANSR